LISEEESNMNKAILRIVGIALVVSPVIGIA